MSTRRAAMLASALAAFLLAVPTAATAAEGECTLQPRTECFGVKSVSATLSTDEAGAHPEVLFDVAIEQDPESKPNSFGLKDGYATTRNIRINLPPGLTGNPNVLGDVQQCAAQELTAFTCPNGSQVGTTRIAAYQLNVEPLEPIYMMQPPGGEAVARLGMVAGAFPIFIDVQVRSEGDYGFVSEVRDAPTAARLIALHTKLWGVPADSSHDNERCTPPEAIIPPLCIVSEKRPPGSRSLPFWTNPTRCGVPLELGVNASSWVDTGFDPAKEKIASIPAITGCNKLPFGPGLTVQPTSHRAASPTGLDMTIRLPGADGVNVLEPSQMRDIRITLPEGLTTNTAVGDGVDTCSVEQVHFKERVASDCPDAARLASAEFDIPIAERRLKGAIYLREPEPGNPFRVWVVADDLGAHVKLPGQLEVDKQTGQIESVVLDSPQVPVREAKIVLKSGSRAPLVTPSTCGTYKTHYVFNPWSDGPPSSGDTKMNIGESAQECASLGGFAPKLVAGTTNPAAGRHSPLVFTLTRQDGEQNPASFDLTLPRGLVATFSGIPRCEGVAALTGACPPGSRIGKATVAVGVGPAPLWVPQPGKRPTAIYLSGPYKGAPLSIVAVVPRQAGPFDFGDEVVRSAIFVDPVSGEATTKTDPLPQLVEGIPLPYRTIHVDLDRPGFALNPTSCAPKETVAAVTSSKGAHARARSPFAAVNCARMGFKPKLSFRLRGGTRRGGHPSLRAVLKPRPGDANIAGASVALPHSEFLDQSHIGTVCTRVQFAAHQCPAKSIYGHVVAKTPLFDETLSGPVYLRSSSHLLPDVVAVLRGPDSLPIEIDLDGRVDSVNGGVRNTFELVPDAPVSSFVLTLKGGEKGLFENSTNLCAKVNRATAKFSAQNGRESTLHPALKVSC